eukprot:COSAG02_NODE_618_length_19461_cov_39.117447_5_plen_174_part_00
MHLLNDEPSLAITAPPQTPFSEQFRVTRKTMAILVSRPANSKGICCEKLHERESCLAEQKTQDFVNRSIVRHKDLPSSQQAARGITESAEKRETERRCGKARRCKQVRAPVWLYRVLLGVKTGINHICRDWLVPSELLTNIRWWEWVVVGCLLGHLSHHQTRKFRPTTRKWAE